MLPAPATSTSKRKLHNDTLRRYGLNRAALLTRSRVTNLGVIILSVTLALSLIANLLALFGSDSQHIYISSNTEGLPKSIEDTLPHDNALQNLENLIIVAGHAVWTGCTPDGRLEEQNWILETRQKGGGNVAAFFRHIEEGARLLHSDPDSLLVFSGGQTRPKSLVTEAQSYHQLATSAHLFDDPTTSTSKSISASQRVVTENYALDSFQNLLFSVARFREVTGQFPVNITVVGFGMKRRRFEELHRLAIRWPKYRFSYVGLDVAGDTSRAYAGEEQFGYGPYSKDLYGCHGELLQKRRLRNPFRRVHPYHTSVPDMVGLLDWCPSGSRKNDVFPGPLPWDIS